MPLKRDARNGTRRARRRVVGQKRESGGKTFTRKPFENPRAVERTRSGENKHEVYLARPASVRSGRELAVKRKLNFRDRLKFMSG